jgi:tetratricopeptide (TPR) repeat protein
MRDTSLQTSEDTTIQSFTEGQNDGQSTFLQGKRVTFVGKLGAFSRKESIQILQRFGAVVVDRTTPDIDWIVMGADELPGEDVSQFLNDSMRRRLREGTTQLIHEQELWQQLGLVEQSTKQLYTPAMMAGLLKTPVRNIRRWHRMGLLTSTRVAHRLPYFDFEQVQNARQLASWIARGARPSDIVKQLSHFAPWVERRSLIDLDLVVDGRRLLLRQGGRLVGAHGQLHLDFDVDETIPVSDSTLPIVLAAQPADLLELDGDDLHTAPPLDVGNWTRDELLRTAEELEDAGQLDQAIEWYRVVLARYGMQADICFQLAELLYRLGDLSAARERYYNAIELEEDFLEARTNLGCVLAETGKTELAIAAFQGAISRDDRYPDVHFHLAKCLDEVGMVEQASAHWLRFLQLAPQSPWADEALDRLGRT